MMMTTTTTMMMMMMIMMIVLSRILCLGTNKASHAKISDKRLRLKVLSALSPYPPLSPVLPRSTGDRLLIEL